MSPVYGVAVSYFLYCFRVTRIGEKVCPSRVRNLLVHPLTIFCDEEIHKWYTLHTYVVPNSVLLTMPVGLAETGSKYC